MRSLRSCGHAQKYFLDPIVFQWNTMGDMIEKTLIRLRDRLGFSQDRLAGALGVQGRLTVYRWEAGLRQPSETIRRLILFLDDLPDKQAQKFLTQLEECGTRK